MPNKKKPSKKPVKVMKKPGGKKNLRVAVKIKKPVKIIARVLPKKDEGHDNKEIKITGSKKQFQLLRGMKDTLPRDQWLWKTVYDKAQELAIAFGFDRLETPVLEDASLFLRGVGKNTDIVEKEMYVFEDRDGEKVALRPENTAAIVRAYLQHGMWNLPQPVRLWYWGPQFRHERPQAGRFRQFTQVGFEVLGDGAPIVDALIILLTYTLYNELGIPVAVHINSIGMPDDRTRYKMELTQYYRQHRSAICENCKIRLMKNPLRLLDCKELQCQEVKTNAPQILDFLSEEARDHFMKVLEYLDEVGVPYLLDHTLVRGLDYYTKTVFEIWTTDEEQKAQGALCGGGRYDLLAEELGGRPTPACGVAPGIERLVTQLKERQWNNAVLPRPQVYVAQLGDLSRRKALALFMKLRAVGILTEQDFSKNSLKSQLESANAKNIPFALIIGQKEVQEGTVILRDMDSGAQEVVDFNKSAQILQRKLGLAPTV